MSPSAQTISATPERTLWMQQALAAEADQDLVEARGNHRVDVCIVGGGLTGLWTALHLKASRPELEVGLLESDICGAGASGANGGFAMTWWPKIKTLRKLFGEQDAVDLAVAAQESVAEMVAFAAEHRIEAEVLPAGWLWAATNPSQVDSWEETLSALDALGQAPFERLDSQQVSQISGSEHHFGGVFESGVATVQPALLTRGLRRVARQQGVRIWERSPMLGRVLTPRGVIVRTPQGTVITDRLVLATNAWLAGEDRVRRHLLVLGSDVLATAPVPELIAESAWKQGTAISDSRRLVHYYRTTREGRVVFGKGGGRISFRGRFDSSVWGRSQRADDLRAQLTRLYPGLGRAPIAAGWAGAVDYSSDALPFAGYLDPGRRISYAAGFSGNGVGPSHLLGKVLAAMATDRDDEWGNSPLIRAPGVHLPPEPIRFAGGHVVRTALRRKESVEDTGRKADPLTRFVAGLDPTSFVG